MNGNLASPKTFFHQVFLSGLMESRLDNQHEKLYAKLQKFFAPRCLEVTQSLWIFIIDTVSSKFTPRKKECGCANRAEGFSAKATKLLLKNRRLCSKCKIDDFFLNIFSSISAKDAKNVASAPLPKMFSEEILFSARNSKLRNIRKFFQKISHRNIPLDS